MSSVASADITKLADSLRESAKGSQETTFEVLLDSSNYIKAEMEQRVPVRTGKLKQSITIRVLGTKVVIGPNTDYDEFVEFGTKPHVIKAKPGKALRFTMGGQTVYVKSVNHPGTRAQPFVRPAFNAWQASLGKAAAEANIKKIGVR